MSDLEERLTEMEIRFTHQTLLIEELNDVVTECNKRIVNLERENRRVLEMLQSLAPSLPESPDE